MSNDLKDSVVRPKMKQVMMTSEQWRPPERTDPSPWIR